MAGTQRAIGPICGDTLVRLRENTGDEDGSLLRQLVETFDQEGELALAELRRAIEQGDPERMARAAHRLKSSASNLGALSMAALCKRIEDAGYQRDMSASESDVHELSTEFVEAANGLRDYLARAG